LCQLIDVGINKSFLSFMREKWENWILKGWSIVNGAMKQPSRQLVAEWLINVYINIPAQTIGNA
jgi:hypothetical protein